MYLLGCDIGSSSIKAALVNAATGETVRVVRYPETETEINAPQPGFAEQDPADWWQNLCAAIQKLLLETEIKSDRIQSIGIAYQMHGLVAVDKNGEVLRPSIIWCDSRAVAIGDAAFAAIGEENCLSHLLNSPGNFTASKLKWVKENEPDIYRKIHKIMLPGDYIAMQLTGEINTTVSGLSEGILWDFKENKTADLVLNHYGISEKLLPHIVATCGLHGKVTKAAAAATGLQIGTPVTYRAGDQPNNALALGVFAPGEIAATGGTSGVVYGVTDKLNYDPKSRINAFAHVNHSAADPRLGLLLCINGAGSQFAWLKNQIDPPGSNYDEINALLETVPVGSEGLCVLPFGNGAERMLENKNPGAHFAGLQFNRHGRAHLYRASLEGIAFAFVYGIKILQDLGMEVNVLKVGNDNLFRSRVFSKTIVNLLGCRIDVFETTGAAGAAKASGIGTGFYKSLEEAVPTDKPKKSYLPTGEKEIYAAAYRKWEEELRKILG